MKIGFELITQRAWTILPGASFLIWILWDNVKIVSSIGKDIFYEAGMILPEKILTGTGRINYMSEETLNRFELLQSKPCRLISCPKHPAATLHLEIIVPTATSVDTIYQTTFIKMWQRKENNTRNTVLYFDPHSVHTINQKRFLIDLSPMLKKLN